MMLIFYHPPISLHRSVSDSDLIFFLKPGEVLIEENIFSAHHDIMYNAFIYLVANHPSYENIIINLENIQTQMNLLDGVVQTVDFTISEYNFNFLASIPGFVNYFSVFLSFDSQTPQMQMLAIVKPKGDVENRGVLPRTTVDLYGVSLELMGGFRIIFLSFLKMGNVMQLAADVISKFLSVMMWTTICFFHVSFQMVRKSMFSNGILLSY